MPATSTPFIDQLATSGTAGRYNGATSLPIPRGVTIKAKAGNGSDLVYVSTDSGISSSTGFELAAGEAIHLPPTYASDMNQIYFRASGNTPGVCLFAP